MKSMDKFVVRGTKPGENSTSGNSGGKRLKQVSIESLKGVVIVEDIVKINRLLRVPDQDPAILLQSLQKLARKTPSRDILKTTKIGHAVKRLIKHDDKSIAELAAQVVNEWKAYFESKLISPTLDVTCDHKTTASRNTARRHIADALQAGGNSSVDAASERALQLERETFKQHRHLINGGYQRTVRRLTLALRQRESLRRDTIDNHLKVPQLVSDYSKGAVPTESS